MEKGKPRHLITTADELTWKFDRPVLFLGDWCRKYHRKHIWEKMDAVVAKPYGIKPEEKKEDQREVINLQNELITKLTELLNQYHKENYDERFWQIVVGAWLRRYIETVFNRVKTINYCFDNYPVESMTIPNTSLESLYIEKSASAHDVLNGTCLDYLIYKDIAKSRNIQLEIIDVEPETKSIKSTGLSLKRKCMVLVLNFFRKIILILMQEKIFFLNTYLPRLQELKLGFRLGQLPQFNFSSSTVYLKCKPVDLDDRRNLSGKLDNSNSGTPACFAEKYLFHALPSSYFENFKNFETYSQKLPWPKKPKLIFTSSNFDTDDVFKIWAAKQRYYNNSVYVLGQHGNGSAVNMLGQTKMDQVTADYYLTWGDRRKNGKYIPTTIFTTAGKKKSQWNQDGGLLLIEVIEPYRVYTWDRWYDFRRYFDEQVAFINKLSKKPRDALTIRFPTTNDHAIWSTSQHWNDIFPGIGIEPGVEKIDQLEKRHRLTVHSYDSTGLLETLSLNMPSLAFWQNDYELLIDSAKPYYKLLADAGIIHFSPESIALKVNEIWDDVSGWWNSERVQDAKNEFCTMYAKSSENPTAEISDVLLKLADNR